MDPWRVLGDSLGCGHPRLIEANQPREVDEGKKTKGNHKPRRRLRTPKITIVSALTKLGYALNQPRSSLG